MRTALKHQNKIFLSGYLYISGNQSFTTFGLLIFYFVPLVQLQPAQSGCVYEDVPSGGIVGNESITFGLIEKFNCSSHLKKS